LIHEGFPLSHRAGCTQMAHSKTPSSSTSTSPSHPSHLTIGAHIERNSSANVSLVLSGLKDVLEAVDTLPCVKYIASIAIKILEVIDVGEPCDIHCYVIMVLVEPSDVGSANE
jgi:hypothetical protein